MTIQCFGCGHKLRTKKSIYRSEWGYPLCKDCLKEHIHDDTLGGDLEDQVFDDIESYYHNSYAAYSRARMIIICPNIKCRCELWMIIGDEIGSCSECGAEFRVDEHRKAIRTDEP